MWRRQDVVLAAARSAHFPDSKHVVDSPLRNDLRTVLDDFGRMPIADWADQHLAKPGSDTVSVQPLPDLTKHNNSSARLLQGSSEAAQGFNAWLNREWVSLCRIVHPDVTRDPDRHSLVPLKRPFVVAGGRFRELYYWDSYFSLRGLILSGFLPMAIDMVENLLEFVETYGFVPNGSRKYYLNRSQPPLLTEMVITVSQAIRSDEQRIEFSRRALLRLEKEYEFFMHSRSVLIKLENGNIHRLNYYCVESTVPRPESLVHDWNLVKDLNEEDAAELLRGITSAAESGWDFSSRWMLGGQTIECTRAHQVVPVCLNVILLRMEKHLAVMASQKGDLDRAHAWKTAAEARWRAICEVMYCPETNMWYDWDLTEYRQRREVVAASGFFPLWAIEGPEDPWLADLNIDQIVDSLMTRSGLVRVGGIAATTTFTGEQWDFPNAWAPIQLIVIEGLENVGRSEMARELASRFLTTMFRGWRSHGTMLEKYDATSADGLTGTGGEYEPQEGFGWTNGVALVLLHRYPTLL